MDVDERKGEKISVPSVTGGIYDYYERISVSMEGSCFFSLGVVAIVLGRAALLAEELALKPHGMPPSARPRPGEKGTALQPPVNL